MLVFIDESGDTGRKLGQGSSKYFVVALVVFEDYEEADACDKRIGLLRREIRKSAGFEFHFQHNSYRVRESFLKAINPYQFMYFCVVIDKDPKKLWGEGFKTKESFYKYACQMVFTNAKPYLENAIVVLDKSGSPTFRSSLTRYLRSKMNGDRKIIKKLKQQKSHGNNLLQLADYVAGIVNRKYQKKKNWREYYRFIRSQEISVQEWPK